MKLNLLVLSSIVFTSLAEALPREDMCLLQKRNKTEVFESSGVIEILDHGMVTEYLHVCDPGLWGAKGDFFDFFHSQWEAEQPHEKINYRPEHLGIWTWDLVSLSEDEKKLNELYDLIARRAITGELIDSFGARLEEVYAPAQSNRSPIVRKSQLGGTRVSLIPTGTSAWSTRVMILVSGTDPQGKYQENLGLIYVDPKDPANVRLERVGSPMLDGTPALLPAHDPKAQFKTHLMFERANEGGIFSLIDSVLPVENYEFELIPAGDGVSFFLLHVTSAVYIGFDKELNPEWLKMDTQNEKKVTGEFRPLGYFATSQNKIAEKLKPYYKFKIMTRDLLYHKIQ